MEHKSKLALGTVQFGLNYGISNSKGQTTQDEVRRILDLAIKNNINLLDTASAYGNSELVLGECGVEQFDVVSKFITPPEGEKVSVQLNNTLNNIGKKSIYGYLSHRPQELVNKPWLWEELDSFKEQGIIQKRGFSLNTPQELKVLLENEFYPDIIQVPYNYIDYRFEAMMIELKAKGCEIHTRSAFLQGLFFKAPKGLPTFFDEVKPVLEDLQSQHVPIARLLLNFVMEKPFIDKVIIGVENSAQLAQNLSDVKSGAYLPKFGGVISEKILMPLNWPKV